jgi:aldose 1-epimerase
MNSFGLLDDGRSVEAITLGESKGLQVEVLTYGAILRRLTYPVRGVRRDLILHFDRLADYVSDRAYVGPLVGRFGNRIGKSTFELDGKRQRVTANEGVNHLHGGAIGFGKRLWRVLDVTRDDGPRVVLGLESPHGEEGYPGTLDVTVELKVSRHALEITLGAQTDAPTPVNLTYHPYFNLAGDFNLPATDQKLRIPAAHYLPVVKGLIPTGKLAPVEGTTFDFRHRGACARPRRPRIPSWRWPAATTIAGRWTPARTAPAN